MNVAELDQETVVRLRSLALRSGTTTYTDGLQVRPDVRMIEDVANQEPPRPAFMQTTRSGRSVYLVPCTMSPPAATYPASPEVVAHHTTAHAEQCPTGGYRERPCLCGSTVALECTSCEAFVFLLLAPGAEPCEHAKARMVEVMEP